MEDDVVIVAATRTAVGKFGGSLAKIPAAELGAKVIKSLLQKTGIQPDQVSEVILGQVLTAGDGQNPARQASIKGGLPDMGGSGSGLDRRRIRTPTLDDQRCAADASLGVVDSGVARLRQPGGVHHLLYGPADHRDVPDDQVHQAWAG